MGKDEFIAVFMGRETFIIGKMKKENDVLFIKKAKFMIPMGSQWIPVLGGDIGEKMEQYNEKIMFDVLEGKKQDNKVRIFPFDLDSGEMDFDKVRYGQEYVKRLEAERDYYFNQANTLKQLIGDSGNDELFKNRVKNEVNFWESTTRHQANQNNDQNKNKKK
ncbi:MAG: hypothetical protein ACE5RP_00045 [Nitrosopumilus sp.]